MNPKDALVHVDPFFDYVVERVIDDLQSDRDKLRSLIKPDLERIKNEILQDMAANLSQELSELSKEQRKQFLKAYYVKIAD